MNLDDYQERAVQTAIYKGKIVYPVLGLASEAGEVAGKLKKILRDNNGTYTDQNLRALADELGDVLWYVAAVAKDLGYTLDTIAQNNLDKLRERQERNVLQGSGDNR